MAKLQASFSDERLHHIIAYPSPIYDFLFCRRPIFPFPQKLVHFLKNSALPLHGKSGKSNECSSQKLRRIFDNLLIQPSSSPT
jgi:hypothetical protein